MHPRAQADSGEKAEILSFADCTVPLAGTAGETFTLDLVVQPGELCMLHFDDSLHEAAVSRAVSGLLEPLSGAVRFLGRDWHDLPPDLANASRGRIGVVFQDPSWIPYHSLMENILLPQLHHTHRPVDEIREEAARWALRFGLPGLPRDLPDDVSAGDRLCANLIRAFIGSPSLVVVEHQATPLPDGLLHTLVNAMRDLRERGAAVLWLTQDMALSLDETIPASQRHHFGGARFIPEERVA